MQISSFVFACLLGVAGTTLAQPADSPAEAKSTSTRTDKTSQAICQVSFDAAGRKSVVMTKSTRSKALDDFIMQDAGHILNGLRSTSFPFFAVCRTVEAITPHGRSEVTVAMLRPSYPHQAIARHEHGSGVVRASFDKSGRAVGAEMTASTGSKILDSHTMNYALAHWRSTGGAKITVDLPVAYRF